MQITVKTQPALIVEFGDTRWAQLLRSAPLTVGRASNADICILHGQVSRYQAVIQPKGAEQFLLLDGDSSGQPSRNGTFVNWEPIRRKILEPGDLICFGSPAAVAHFCLLDEKELSHQDKLFSVKAQIEAKLTDRMETLTSNNLQFT